MISLYEHVSRRSTTHITKPVVYRALMLSYLIYRGKRCTASKSPVRTKFSQKKCSDGYKSLWHRGSFDKCFIPRNGWFDGLYNLSHSPQKALVDAMLFRYPSLRRAAPAGQNISSYQTSCYPRCGCLCWTTSALISLLCYH